MEITGAALDEFRKDFKECVSALEEKYGVTIKLGRITYGEERFSGKMTVVNGREAYEVDSLNFDADVWRYEHLGLRPGMYNRMFIGVDGKRYAIQGFNTRAKKYPLRIVRFEDGEQRVAGERFVKEWLDEYYAG